MTAMNDREKAFENKFAHDAELQFKVNARRNKLLGLWVAEKLGKTGADAEAYAKDVVMSDFEKPGFDDVLHKINNDVTAARLSLTKQDICAAAEQLFAEAKAQVMAE